MIHLPTPAAGQGYDRSKPLRVEQAEETAEIDARIELAWRCHRKRTIIDSTADFATKTARALTDIGAELPECCKPHRS